MRFHNLFVGKARQLIFEADITVHHLENVPLLAGNVYAKLKMPSGLHSARVSSLASDVASHASSSALSTVSTTASSSVTSAATAVAAATAVPSSHRAPLRDHAASWNWSYAFDAHLTKDEAGVLDPWPFLLIIKLDRSDDPGLAAGAYLTERIGVLHLDLAHFAGAQGMTRKFLLQETRINSTVKITVAMSLKAGDPLFKVPELPSDLQIDISRFTKSSFDDPPPHADGSSGQFRSGSTSDATSVASGRIMSAAARAVAAPPPPSPFSYVSGDSSPTHYNHHGLSHPPSSSYSTHTSSTAYFPSSSGTPASIYTAGSGGSSSSRPRTTSYAESSGVHNGGALESTALALSGALPHLPNADPRPSAAIVDDLFAQVLAASRISGPGSDLASGRGSPAAFSYRTSTVSSTATTATVRAP
ncbi:hypothetical protein BC828DRAFT_409593 [Blastocladiella britannica]|nr:hypothetical protein BC828DRAFT_409593 [Blastocladiella britannica]